MRSVGRRLSSWAIWPVVGAVSALGFEPFNLLPVTLIALAALFRHLVAAPSARSAFATGWRFGVGQFVVSLSWIATSFTFQDKMPTWLGGLGVIIVSTYLALFPGLACALAWWAGRRDPLRFTFFFAAAWMLAEYLRGTLFTGFPWNPLGVTWLPLLPIARSGAWVGTYGLSALVILAAGALWLLSLKAWRAAVIVGVPIVALPLLVAITLRALPQSNHHPAIPVRIVQPNVTQDIRNDPATQAVRENAYLALSGKPAVTPRVLLWPEASTDAFLQIAPEKRAEYAKLLGVRDLMLVGGLAATVDASDDLHYYNAVFALDPRGALRWNYAKAHLVPFGEYLPFRNVLSRIGLSRLVPGAEDFSAGPGARTFELPGFGKVGVQICYEIIFSGRVVDRASRPDFLFNPSNDAWFGSFGPPQHLAQARLRAIEEGVPVVRATPNGISAVIDASGHLLAAIPVHRSGVIDIAIPPALEPTIFARLGLWSSALFMILLAALGLALAGRAHSRRSPDAP